MNVENTTAVFTKTHKLQLTVTLRLFIQYNWGLYVNHYKQTQPPRGSPLATTRLTAHFMSPGV